jgi:alpha-galactosidase
MRTAKPCNKRQQTSLTPWLIFGVLALLLFFASAYAEGADSSAGKQWLQEHFSSDTSKLPFSFVYGLKSSRSFLKDWPRKIEDKQLDGTRTKHVARWTDAKTGLEVRVEAVEFANSPVVEWTAYFKNGGNADTPVLEDVHALDLPVSVAGRGIPTIMYSRGVGGMDTFALRKKPLNQLEDFRISNEGGGKTGETIPFFDIRMEGRGLIGAVGWAGKWAISFSRPEEEAISVRAGMQNVHISLHAGEEIRSPLILLLPWEGDEIDAHNTLRRHVLKYHTPQYDGKPVVLPISHLGWGGMKTSTSLRLIDEVTKEKLGFENFWMDAGWYGTDRPVDEFQVFGGEDWFLHAGNWRVNKVANPNGLRPISDAAHANGMKYLLWFEPERAVVGTPWTLEHPDWFIGEEGTNFAGHVDRPYVKFRLFNFGNPTARKAMIDSMSELITKEGIDIFRQDCNFALAPFWAQADSGDRRGITEIRYVEGLLEFWDELRRRHPGLMLDIVQRGDLDTISRAVDLSRADYTVAPDSDPIGNQVSTEGLAYWRPHFGTILQIRPRDNYHFRSGSSAGLAFALFNVSGTRDQIGTFIPPNFPFDWLRTEIANLKRLRPYYYGDYYPMLPCSSNVECITGNEQSAAFEWAAWQFNRPEENDGMVQAFRRTMNDDSTKTLRLRGLDASANYEISDLDGGVRRNVSGKELMQQGLVVEIGSKPGATVILYKKVK